MSTKCFSFICTLSIVCMAHCISPMHSLHLNMRALQSTLSSFWGHNLFLGFPLFPHIRQWQRVRKQSNCNFSADEASSRITWFVFTAKQSLLMLQCFEHKTVYLLAKENKHTKQPKGRSHHRQRNLWDCAKCCRVAILVCYTCPPTAELSSIFLPKNQKSPRSCHGKGDASQRLQPLSLVCHWADPLLIRTLLFSSVTPAAPEQPPSTRPKCFQYIWSFTECWNMYEIQARLLGSSRQKSGMGTQCKVSTSLLQARQKSHSACKPQFRKPGYLGFLQSKHICC